MKMFKLFDERLIKKNSFLYSENQKLKKENHQNKILLNKKVLLVSDVKIKDLKLNFFDKWKLKRHPNISYIITMQFNNATCRTMIIKTKTALENFKILGDEKHYILDTTKALYDTSLNQYHLFYNENYVMPIEPNIIYSDGKSKDLYGVVVPENVKPFIRQNFLKSLVTLTDTPPINWKLWLILGGIGLVIIYFVLKQNGG